MEWMTSPELWVAFVTLLMLEIVLGIDNVIFISILAGRLPEEQRRRARVVGLSLALITRLLLLVARVGDRADRAVVLRVRPGDLRA